jgi:hypothetical protein
LADLDGDLLATGLAFIDFRGLLPDDLLPAGDDGKRPLGNKF